MIFYFSGTGNTRWVAETISKATDDTLVDITDGTACSDALQAIRARLSTCETTAERSLYLGFCFPVHGWKPPRIFREFIRSLASLQISGYSLSDLFYCYAVCTCGDSIGKAMDVFSVDLRSVGITLHTAFSLIMPESYVCLPFMYTDTPEREQQKISVSCGILEETIVPAIKRCERNIWQVTEGPAPWILTYIVGSFFSRFMITDRPFRVDVDVCRHCGICKNVCPTSNIVYSADGLPQWKCNGSCTCCLACYHHCPVHAINYRNITRKRGQYYFRHK